MTTKLVLYTSKKLSDGQSPIRVRIIQNRKVRYVSTGYNCYPHEWDGNQLNNDYKKRNKLTQDQFENINSALRDKLNEVVDIKATIQKSRKVINLNEVVKKVKKSVNMSFDKYTELLMSDFEATGQIGSRKDKAQMLSSLRKYKGSKTIDFSDIDYSWLDNYVKWHKEKGNDLRTANIYLRAVRNTFNRAIKDIRVKLDKELYPFGLHGFSIDKETSTPKKSKRAIDKSVIAKIAALDLPENSDLWHARNYFMLAFYWRGMNFIDFCVLRANDIAAGRVEYIRQKTKRKGAKAFNIAILPEAQKILDFYFVDKEPEDRIFPIFDKELSTIKGYSVYEQKRKNYNKYLSKIAAMVGVQKITTYTVRHSWAMAAKKSKIDLESISDGMGQSDTKVTRAYLDSIENTELDEANAKLVASVLKPEKQSEPKKRRLYRRFKLEN